MDFGALLHYAKKKNDAATKNEVCIRARFHRVYKYLSDAPTVCHVASAGATFPYGFGVCVLRYRHQLGHPLTPKVQN